MKKITEINTLCHKLSLKLKVKSQNLFYSYLVKKSIFFVIFFVILEISKYLKCWFIVSEFLLQIFEFFNFWVLEFQYIQILEFWNFGIFHFFNSSLFNRHIFIIAAQYLFSVSFLFFYFFLNFYFYFYFYFYFFLFYFMIIFILLLKACIWAKVDLELQIPQQPMTVVSRKNEKKWFKSVSSRSYFWHRILKN